MTVILYSIGKSARLAAESAENPARPAVGDNAAMYIIAIGWLYVTVLMALTETSIVAGVLTLFFYGLLLLWLLSSPVRRQRRRYREAQEEAAAEPAAASAGVAADQFADTPDRKHAQADQ
jgi:Ca2+/Na+ antiporter